MARHGISERALLLRGAGLAWVLAPRPSAPPTQQPATPPPPAHDEKLPTILRALFHGKQSPLHTLWTYAELWEDLQRITPPRLEFIRRIQGACAQHLGWDLQRMALWPCHDPDLWRAGLARLAPKHILVFGEAATTIGTAPASCSAKAITFLPDLDSMLAGKNKAEAWEILRNIPLASD
jgi:hypothetical protein